MQTRFFPKWLRLAVILLLLLTTLAISPAHADGPFPGGIISAGVNHTCALRPDNSVDCWGENLYGEAEDQVGPYIQVSAGGFYTCALTPSGAMDCWGYDLFGNIQDQPGPYTRLSANLEHICALTPSGAVECWGYNTSGQSEDQPGPYTLVGAGFFHNCALSPTGAAECWGFNHSGQAEGQPGPYVEISAGYGHTCGLTPSGAIDCWGSNVLGQAEDQPGPYIQLSAGNQHTCALTPEGAADCWGFNGSGEAEDQPGPYVEISAGFAYTCALTPFGAVDCWGLNVDGQAEDQPGPYGPYEPIGDTISPFVTVTGVTEGSTYILGAVPQAGCSTTDEGSGVAVEASLSLTGGNSLGVGSFTATCSGALDNAGNQGNTAVVNYSVAFQFTGFTAPVDNPPVMNVARAGQVIPLKWRLTDASGNPVLTLTDVTVSATSLSCDTATSGDSIEEFAGGNSGLQNLSDGYYQWNWKTPASYANSCKTLSLDMGEGAGSEHTALFQFKK